MVQYRRYFGAPDAHSLHGDYGRYEIMSQPSGTPDRKQRLYPCLPDCRSVADRLQTLIRIVTGPPADLMCSDQRLDCMVAQRGHRPYSVV